MDTSDLFSTETSTKKENSNSNDHRDEKTADEEKSPKYDIQFQLAKMRHFYEKELHKVPIPLYF